MTKTEILKLIDTCRDMVITVAEDYLTAEGMRTEMLAAFENLVNDISEDPAEAVPLETPAILYQLNALYQDTEVQADEILNLLDKDEIIEYLTDDGYQLLRLDYLQDREKLRNFLETEIYTSYNQQKANLFL